MGGWDEGEREQGEGKEWKGEGRRAGGYSSALCHKFMW